MNNLPTFHPVIRTTQVKQNGTTNIKICVTHNRRSGYLPTKHFVTIDEFDRKIHKVIPTDKSEEAKKAAGKINSEILAEIGAYANRVNLSKEKLEHYTLSMLLVFLADETDPTDFISLLEKKIKEKKEVENLQYAASFKATKSILSKYGYEKLMLETITGPWLKALAHEWKKKKLKANTIGHHMRNIRTVFNEAKTGRYPFHDYEIPKAKETEHRDLSVEEIATIAKIEIPEPLMRWSRDMFMLSFYLIGINMVDLAYLKEVREGRIEYVRSKGKKEYSIKVFPEAQAIIDRYPGKKYLINILDNYADHRGGMKRIDKKLKKIAERCKIDRPISTYYARHSWASIASELEIHEDIISRSMGHAVLSPINGMTKIYIRKQLAPCDDANEKVIKAILKDDDDDVITSLNL